MLHRLRLGIHHKQLPIALLEACVYSVAQASFVLARHLQAVYHQLHIVVAIAVELHAKSYFSHLSVHSHIEVTFLAELLKEILIVSFTPIYQRCEQVNLLAVEAFKNERQNFVERVFYHFLAREVAIGIAGSSKEQAQV